MKKISFLAACLLSVSLALSAQCTVGFSTQQDPNNSPVVSFIPWVMSGSDYINDYTLLWQFGDGNSTLESFPTNTYPTAGYYSVCLTANLPNGCSATTCSTITVSTVIGAICIANFQAVPIAIDSVTSISTMAFTDNSSSAQPILTYWWDFGDGTSSNAPNPTHSYENGAYAVCLTIMSGMPGSTSFCTDQQCVYINIGDVDPPVVISTSISELLIEPFSMTALPSITTSEATLRLICPIAYSNLSIVVYNSGGVPIWSHTADFALGTYLITVPSQHWRRGLYMAVASAGGLPLGTAKFVKQ